VIDDQELMRDSLTTALTREDHQVRAFGDPVDALSHIRETGCDAVLTDVRMPRLDGISLLRELRKSGADMPVIVMTGYADVPAAVEAMKLGAFDYVQKPFEADEICILVDRAIQQHRLRMENEALRTTLCDLEEDRRLIGESAVMDELRAVIERVSASSATVLIQGESGTGKELVARSVHASSPRAAGPMLCLNCAALSSQLLESELFGHERGAFTGADRLRKGRFELADGGTLLLDEISEMPLNLQAKLLRVLQDKQFERVGSSATRTVDVRVIATTNRDLEEWVSRGEFREDLFYRLRVLPVHVRPLRERAEDIPVLTRYFLDRIARRDGRRPLEVDRDAMRLMREYPWPGNIRELENVCERSAVLAADGRIASNLIEPWLSERAAPAAGVDGFQLRPGRMMQDMERQLIERTLQQMHGHRVKTARALGIGLRTLGLKLKRWRDEGVPVSV
jgi:DNA-binding NtrC family response regulator